MIAKPIPLDVLFEVIDILIIENTYDSMITLKTCALLCRAVVAHIQRHLFRQLRIGLNQRYCTSLYSLLTQGPHLAYYVKSLSVGVYSHKDASPGESALAAIIPSLSSLKSLTLLPLPNVDHWGKNISFRYLSPSLRLALLSRFRTINHLEISNICDIPMTFIASCPLLKKFIIFMPPFVSNFMWEDPVASSLIDVDAQGTCLLEHLDINNYSHLHLPIFKDFHLHMLKSLSVYSPSNPYGDSDIVPFSAISPLLHGARSSLESLSIGAIELLSSDSAHDLALPALQFLSIKMVIHPSHNPDPECILNCIALSLEIGDQAVHRPLKNFEIHVNTTGPEIVASYNAWRRIDEALSQPRYSGFTKLYVFLLCRSAHAALDYYVRGRMEVEKQLLQSFQMLESNKLVEINVW